MNRRTYLILAISAIVVAIYQIFTLGYGDSGRILYNTSQAIAEHTDYADEHLSIIYERKIGDETDFIHLKVDTTYHEIGKGAYKYEILCNRKYSLRSFSDKYHKMDHAIAHCFVGNNDTWQRSNASQRRIMNYECERATRLIDGESYEAWYTDALPHQRPNSRAKDEYRGVILEARDADGRYSLRVKYIGEQIG